MVISTPDIRPVAKRVYGDVDGLVAILTAPPMFARMLPVVELAAGYARTECGGCLLSTDLPAEELMAHIEYSKMVSCDATFVDRPTRVFWYEAIRFLHYVACGPQALQQARSSTLSAPICSGLLSTWAACLLMVGV